MSDLFKIIRSQTCVDDAALFPSASALIAKHPFGSLRSNESVEDLEDTSGAVRRHAQVLVAEVEGATGLARLDPPVDVCRVILLVEDSCD